MTPEQLKVKIYDWIKNITSYDDEKIFWVFQKMPTPYAKFITLNILDITDKTPFNAKNYKNDGTIEVLTNMLVNLSINFYGEGSELDALLVWKSLKTDSTKQFFGLDVGYSKPSELRNLSYFDEDNQEPIIRNQFDIKFNIIQLDTDDTGYFDKVILNGYIQEEKPENLFYNETLPNP